MNPDFDPLKHSMQPSSSQPISNGANSQGQSEATTLQRERFELLSAYLDGEVTAAERKQVEAWLATDVTVQQLHARLLKLRQGFHALPVPASTQPVEATVEKVLARLDRRPKLSLIWGGSAKGFAVPIGIAALFVGAMTIFSPFRAPVPQVATQQPANQQPQESLESEGLLVALDRPVLSIPKTATVDAKTPKSSGLTNKSNNAQ